MSISLRDKLFIAFQISRRVGWLIAPLVYLIGLIYSGATVSINSVLQLIILSFPFSILLFGINDVYDRECDRQNPRKSTYLNKDIEVFIYRISLITVLSLLIISLVTLNYFNIVSTVITLLISYFYSARPVRFKEIPFLDSFSNGTLFFSVFSMGYSFGGSLGDIPVKIYYVALCVMGIHAFGAALDYDTDKAAAQMTIAVRMGKRGTFLFTFLTFILTYIFSGIGSAIINKYLLFCSVISLAAFIYPNNKLEVILFKLLFMGFLVTSVIFLFKYSGV